jgi:hypothetical protein
MVESNLGIIINLCSVNKVNLTYYVKTVVQGGQMKSGQILSRNNSKTVLNIVFKFIHWLLSTLAVYRDQSQHNGYRFRTSGRGYVD